MLLWKKEVMPHQSGKAFSEEFVTIFVAGSGQWSIAESSKAPGSKTIEEEDTVRWEEFSSFVVNPWF